MPVAEKRSVDANLASEGRHIAQLISVVEERIKSQYPDSVGDGKAAVWYWNFRSKTENEETGEREQFRQMTNAEMTPNNNNTKFWKKLLPGMEYEDLSGDTDDVVGKWFEVELQHEKKGDKVYANIAFIKPYKKPAGKPAKNEPTEQELEDEDPYADE